MQRMKYVQPFDEADTVDSGVPQIPSTECSQSTERIILASHIGGGHGPGLDYHHSNQANYLIWCMIKSRLGDMLHNIATYSLGLIPAGLPYCD